VEKKEKEKRIPKIQTKVQKYKKNTENTQVGKGERNPSIDYQQSKTH